MSAEPAPSYVFGPLERRGLIAGLRGGQIALISLGVAGLVFALSVSPLIGVAILLVGLGLAFAPMGGRNADLWAPITTAFWVRRLLSGGQWRNDAMRLGHVEDEPPWPTLPAHLAGLRILDVPSECGAAMGVIHDGHTYAAILSVRPEAFALCDSAEQARRLAGWGGILAGIAREASPVTRIQWVERTAPADGATSSGRARRSSPSRRRTPCPRATCSW